MVKSQNRPCLTSKLVAIAPEPIDFVQLPSEWHRIFNMALTLCSTRMEVVALWGWVSKSRLPASPSDSHFSAYPNCKVAARMGDGLPDSSL